MQDPTLTPIAKTLSSLYADEELSPSEGLMAARRLVGLVGLLREIELEAGIENDDDAA